MACRSQAKQNANQQRNQRGEAQNRKINRDAVTARKTGSRQTQQERYRAPGQQKPQSDARNGHQNAFRQQLADNVGAPRPQGGTHRDLAPPAGGANQQKIGTLAQAISSTTPTAPINT